MLVTVDKKTLYRLRKEKGYSMHRLSLAAGLGKNAVEKMEKDNGKSSFIRVQAIAHVLNVEPSVLINKEA